MIPKVIHYFWFGENPVPKSSMRCIESWKKHCPEYEIRVWNESNYNYKKNVFITKAAQDKKWSFVSDYARLDVLYRYGGVYLDTDVELLKPLDPLLKYRGFFGFETDTLINLGEGFGAEASLPLLKQIMAIYDILEPVLSEDRYADFVCPKIQTPVFKAFGFRLNGKEQKIDNVVLLPKDAMCPLNYDTGELNISANTYSVHWYHATWKSLADRKVMQMQQKLTPSLGKKWAGRFAVLIQYSRYKGVLETLKYYINKMK